MAFSLNQVEGLAPDQSSLSAARSLLKAALWPVLGQGDGLCWGECQGSGATPYRVAVSEADAGSKCTCPSRKFPCKHALALMWIRAEEKFPFTPAPVPEWVKDWLSRRRGGSRPPGPDTPSARPSIRALEDQPATDAPDPQAEAKSAAARERHRAGRESAMRDGLAHLDTWLSDQTERGMAAFVANCNQACRTIAQRLVDAKAPGLAGRLDALPARLFTLDEAARPYAAIRELGQLHLISQAFRRAAELEDSLAADARHAAGWPLTREALLADASARRVRAHWRVFAVVTEVQADRLRRIETWLRAENEPCHAVLLDFVPVSSGAASNGYSAGDRMEAELVFYRSPVPLRAQIAAVFQGTQSSAEPLAQLDENLTSAYSGFERALQALPWLGTFPLSFRGATVRRRDDRLYLCDGTLALPLHSSLQTQALPLAAVGPLDGIGLWNGYDFTLAWAETRLGRWVRP